MTLLTSHSLWRPRKQVQGCLDQEAACKEDLSKKAGAGGGSGQPGSRRDGSGAKEAGTGGFILARGH